MDELLSVLFCSGSVGASHDGTRLGNKRDGGKERRQKTDRMSRKSMEELFFSEVFNA